MPPGDRRDRRSDLPRARKRGRAWFVRDAVIVLVMALVVFAVFTQLTWFTVRRDIGERVLVEVRGGAPLREIARELEKAGVVRSSGKFVLAVRVLGLTEKLQAGTYEFGPRLSELDVLRSLRYGEVAGRRITVPEGYRASQIAALLERKLGIDSGEFMELVHDPEVMRSLDVSAPSLEGYLHPDTYRMRLDATAREAIEMMVEETMSFLEGPRRQRAESIGLTVHQVLTLASIIEAEALFDRERPRISAVYHNRLERGWRLEADPTVRYALGKYGRKLYYKDLDSDSPYNTYRNAGLPPGPICSPGKASITAALYPDPDSEDFFFVADGDGTHTFSRTFSEHVKAKARARDRRKAQDTGFSLDTDEDG
ncbi:MAG: endolytic transglycosylase MltG [Candidatus Eisenbacteria bacterium]|nr:endolytic transglycosylase MltG [Candidatus Eisenbacteria bacterium]